VMGISVTYAGFGRRLAAFMIDLIMLFIVIGVIFGQHYVKSPLLSFEGIITNLVGVIITTYFWIKYLGTPGKLLLDCQVVDANTGKSLNIKQALIRYLAYYASLLPFLLGFIWVAFDKRKQGFHDRIANTIVLHRVPLDSDDASQKPLLQILRELR
jgi:uncharacterized RDD family membrane protein YckC